MTLAHPNFPVRPVGSCSATLVVGRQVFSCTKESLALCGCYGHTLVTFAFSAALGVFSRACQGDLIRTPAALSPITVACSFFPYPNWLGSYPVSLYSAGDFTDCWACNQPAGGSLLSEFEILAAKKARTGLGDPSPPITSFI